MGGLGYPQKTHEIVDTNRGDWVYTWGMKAIDPSEHFQWNESHHDLTPRYAPDTVVIMGYGQQPVTRATYYPVGLHPRECPIRWDMNVLELRTPKGNRYYGCESAHINSELRMVVVGCDSRDEVRMMWKPVPKELGA